MGRGRTRQWLGLGSVAAVLSGLVLSAAASPFASAAPTRSFVLSVPAAAVAGAPFSATITAVKPTGATDTSYKGDKTLTWSGPGTAPDGVHAPSYPANPVTFASGVATVSITLFRAETTTVQVSDGSTAGSAGLTVSAAAPATLAFVQQPTETQVSSVIDAATSPAGVRVQAKDAYGNPADNTSVAIAIGANPPGDGVLSGTTTQPTDSSGVAAFTDLSIDRVGVGYTLVATAPATASTATQTSVAFIIAQTVNHCGSTCSASASLANNTTLDVSANGTLSGNTLGIALIGAVSPPPGVCPGFTPAIDAPGSYVNVTSTSSDSQPTLTVVWTLDKSIVDIQPENGASHYDLCLGSVNLLHASDPTFNSGWITKDGTTAVRVYDPVFGVYFFWGLIADCPNRGPAPDPCAVSRTKDQLGDFVLTYSVAYPWDPTGWLG